MTVMPRSLPAPRPDTARRLPDFIVIGAMRAGTTSLHHYLSHHPQIAMTREKEPEFFIEARFGRGVDWYMSQFPEGAALRGEVSPNYAKADVFPGVPQRIHRLIPNVRLIYVVRDPVTRFVSQYMHMRARGLPLPGPEALCTREPSLPEGLIRLGHAHPYRHLLSVSCYARQLKPYLALFSARQIHVVDFETLRADPQTELSALHDFLGLDPAGPLQLPEFNRSAELTRLPRPILRSARDGMVGRWLRARTGLATRDRVKRGLATLFPADTPQFPDAALRRIRSDLARDVAEFRALTGRGFEGWSL